MFGSSFGTGNTPTLFGGVNQTQNMFNTQPTMTGTPNKFNPLNSTDTIQKGGNNTTIQTKIHSISAMPEYESKTFEELRWEDYQANRKTGNLSMFGGGSSGVFGTTNAFSSFNNQSSQQQNQNTYGGGNLFNNTQPTQLNTSFGTNLNKAPLFGTNTTSTGFGGLNNTTKSTMFGNPTTQVANKPLFGATNTNSSLFGGNTNQQSNVFGGNQLLNSSTNYFGGINKPQTSNQPTSFFGNNTNPTSNSSFAFNNASNTATAGNSLFGAQNTAIKSFGSTNSSFGFGTNTNTTSTNIFGGNQQASGNLFGQNIQPQQQQQSVFGASTSKPSLFSTTNTAFNTAQPTATSQNLFQPTTSSAFGVGAGTTTSLFGANQQKPATSAFGASNLGVGNTGSLFNTNPQQNTTGSGFGTSMLNPSGSLFNSSSMSNQQNIVSNPVITAPIGYNDPNEAYMQQKMFHMKFLNLLNKPYAINKLFVNSNLNDKDDASPSDKKVISNVNSQNSLSTSIRRNDSDQYSVRRRVLKSNYSLKNFNRIFNGLDDEDDVVSNKSSHSLIDKCFLTKREDWKSLPADAFEKSNRRSINSNNSLLSEQHSIRKDNSIHETSTVSSAIQTNINSRVDKSKDRNCSTPLPHTFASDKPELIVSPIERELPKVIKDTTDHKNIKEKEKVIKLNGSPISKPVETSVKDVALSQKLSRDDQRLSKVTLTKPGYYISPTLEVLDKLVTTNDYGAKECWVENFVIGRKDFGSIKFLNETNLYGLNFDELVEINKWEVLVYPDDNLKPEVGEGLNKPAQVILHKVYPTDKTNGGLIQDPDRLKEINFEKKLRRDTEKMDAEFLKYQPEDGLWVFEVKHFSKYKFTDDSDEDSESKNESSKERNQNKNTNTKNEDKSKVVRAEADSMTDDNMQINSSSFTINDYHKYGNDGSFNNSGYSKMRSALFVDNANGNDEDDDIMAERYDFLNRSKSKVKSQSFLFTDIKQDMEEPLNKRFETSEMGRSIMKSSTVNNNSTSTMLQQTPSFNQEDFKLPVLPYLQFQDLIDPHKPIESEQLAPTKLIVSKTFNGKLFSKTAVKNINFTSDFMHDRLLKYIENRQSNYLLNELVFSNRFRCGLFHSANGLIFYTKESIDHDITSTNDLKMSTITHFRKPNSNLLHMKKIHYESKIETQLDCLKTAISVSELINENYIQWSPIRGLSYLKKYAQLKFDSTSSDYFIARIISLSEALWCEFKDTETETLEPDYFKQLARKQSLSKWIRAQCIQRLKRNLSAYLENDSIKSLHSSCFPLILDCLVSGEIKLAAYLASTKNNYRLSLLISQITSSNMTYRDIALEQLYWWTQNREDISINRDLLKIYALLAGQTSFGLSDGSIIYVLEGKDWWQAFGCYMWFILPYLASIKDALKLYEEEFKLEANIPKPNPIDVNKIANMTESDYNDICFHLIKLFTEPVYDVQVLLNPPTISSHYQHNLLWNWFESWHSSLILLSLGFEVSCFDKICLEYATQLERVGMWEWSIFVLLHIYDDYNREKLTTDTVYRNVNSVSKTLNGKEQFVVEDLRVSKEIIHQGKAVFCKNKLNSELEAYHLFEARSYEKSCRMYCSKVLPNLVINDCFTKINEILNKFISLQLDKNITNWSNSGELFVLYLSIQSEIKSLGLTNKLFEQHSLCIDINEDPENSKVDLGTILGDNESGNVNERIENLKKNIKKLEKALDNYTMDSKEQIICFKQMKAICENMEICTREE